MGKVMKQILRIPYGMFNFLAYRGFFKWIPDEPYLKIQYKTVFGCELNLDKPKTFNEKLQWLKLHDRNPLFTILADKYAVREYIKENLGEEYLIPLVGGPWKNADEIKFDELPNQFVLKCTHDSGGLVICRDKSTLNIKATKKMLNKKLKKNYYYWTREWPYKNIKPQIIAEKYIGNNSLQQEPVDYKVFCFEGEPKVIMTVTGGHENEKNVIRRIYDVEWNKQNVGVHGKENYIKAEPQPEQLNQLVAISRKLSKGIKHVRLDFYIINKNLKFGEFTFYHMSGYERFSPEKWNLKLGQYIQI